MVRGMQTWRRPSQSEEEGPVNGILNPVFPFAMMNSSRISELARYGRYKPPHRFTIARCRGIFHRRDVLVVREIVLYRKVKIQDTEQIVVNPP